MKKYLAYLLVFVMTISLFCGCNSKESNKTLPNLGTSQKDEVLTAEELVGTWTLQMGFDVFSQVFSQLSSENDATYDSTLYTEDMGIENLEFEVTFQEDGTAIYSGQSLMDAELEMADKMFSWMRKDDNFYIYMERAGGISREEVDLQLEKNGQTKEDVIDTLEAASTLWYENLDENTEDEVSYYTYEDGKLFFLEEGQTREDVKVYMLICKRDNKLVVTDLITE